MKFSRLLLVLPLLAVFSCTHTLKDGTYQLTVLSTDDVHGAWFDSTYTGGGVRRSLMAVKHYADSVRAAVGAENVLFVDAGDCLQGDNAAYYFNYVDTLSPHLFPRIMSYMGYDAIAIGNHDIETGHPVYDRVQKELEAVGLPFLGANCVRNDNGKPYFPPYKIFKRAGLRVAVLGYGNANIPGWLSEPIWAGMHFDPVASRIQADVDELRAREHPDVVVALMHTATGKGDGSVLEAEALDAMNSVRGVDFVICGHDHRPLVITRDTCVLMNSGSHSRFVAEGKLTLTVSGGKVVSREYASSLIPVKAEAADTAMRAHFQKEFEAVRAFTLQEVGVLNVPLVTRDAYRGMSPYINLIHTLSLGCAPADLSFAAPLTYNGTVAAGILRYNDLFTIYPFENQLFVVKMSGAEIRQYLEASYDQWIQTVGPGSQHLLKIVPRDDPRTQQTGWSFVNRSYNFDSAGGLHYTVDVTQPLGSRIAISGLADGRSFDESATYNVAMTSYRASGGGGLLQAAGIDTSRIDDRVVARYPEIRNLLYDYLQENGSIDPEVIGNPSVIGSWSFVPEQQATPLLDRDMALLFH